MKHTTDIRNKTVLIKSLKKINKIKHRYSVGNSGKYSQQRWDSHGNMDHLAGTTITLMRECSPDMWAISPWMVQAIIDCPNTIGTLEYPYYIYHKTTGTVLKVLDDSTVQNTLVQEGVSYWKIAEADPSEYVVLPTCPETGFYHMQPVFAWDDKDKYLRSVRFYNAIEKGVISYHHKELVYTMNNYGAIEPQHITSWMMDTAVELLNQYTKD